jgi:hypothetical protein
MAIKISLVSDVADAIRGAERVADSYDEVADSLEDLAREARRSEDSLEDVGDGAKSAEGEAEKMERSFRDAIDAVKDTGKAAKDLDGEKIEIDVDIDKERSREALNSFKEDVADSGNESGQELAGSMMDGFNGENVVEALTEVVAEATENMSGPMQAAGIGLAIVIALAYAEMAKLAEKTNEAKEAGGEWATSFNTASVSDKLSALRDRFQEFATEIADESEWFEFGEAAETALEQIIDGANEGGVSVRDFMEAFNETDATRRLELLQAALDRTNERTAALRDESNAAVGNFGKAWDIANRTRELNEAADALEGLVDEQRIAIETEAAMADAMGLSVDQFREYNELSDEAKERIDGMAREQRGLAVQTERANEELAEQNELTRELIGSELDWLDTLDGLTEQVEENGSSLSKNTARGRENIRYILDAVDSIDALYEATLEETGSQERAESARRRATRELEEQARAAGFNEREIRDLIDRINKMPRSKTTDIKADTRDARRSVNEFVNSKPSPVGVGVYADTTQAQRDVSSFRYMVQATPLQMILRAA